jgi:hypothetical protein
LTINKALLAVILLLAAVAASAQPDTRAADLAGTRPNAGGDPEQVTIRLGLLDIAEIDDREQVFTADLFLQIEWQDPRLAVSGDAQTDLRRVALDDIWNPRLAIVNNRGLDLLLPEVATVDRQGNVIVRQRLAGPLAVRLDLREFPFDRQRLPIEVVSYQYSPAEIVFSADSEMVANLDRLSGHGWTYLALEPQPFVYRLRDDGRGGSGMVFAVSADREADYYLLTLALPMTLILFLAWMVHWLPVEVTPARMGTASAAIFSLIALGISIRLTLPRIAYLTDADVLVLYSTLLVLVSLAATVMTARLVGAGKNDSAALLARHARRAFPFLYALIVAVTFVT